MHRTKKDYPYEAAAEDGCHTIRHNDSTRRHIAATAALAAERVLKTNNDFGHTSTSYQLGYFGYMDD